MHTWSSIERVERPANLEDAARLCDEKSAALLAGGTYLVAKRPEGVRVLIDIGRLVSRKIMETGNSVQLGTGLTLQMMVDGLKDKTAAPLAEAARMSESSRNQRNRRTLGGEIANNRLDSDLIVALTALNPTYEIITSGNGAGKQSSWGGQGLIASLEVEKDKVARLQLQRFSLLPTSPAFLLVATAPCENGYRVAVGGRVSNLYSGTISETSEAEFSRIAKEAGPLFADDHTGSREYKQHLVRTALERMEL